MSQSDGSYAAKLEAKAAAADPKWRSFYTEFAATMRRIDQRISGELELERERRQALDWCRKNGNPHLQKEQRA